MSVQQADVPLGDLFIYLLHPLDEPIEAAVYADQSFQYRYERAVL